MKLVIAILQGRDASALLDALTRAEFRATRFNSAGGFLRETNATIMTGVENDKVDEVLRIIRESCHTRTQYVNPILPVMEPGELYMPNPVEVQLGGATVFVLDVERYERV
ncbi:MAG: cyclic-di-AMP receptor [Chloroflexi bacterium]|nr:cyclic-di-AMP receptor [Chloroflexota bacterium]